VVVVVVVGGRGRRPDRRGGQGRRRGAPRVRQAAGGRRQPLLNDLLAGCEKRDYGQCRRLPLRDRDDFTKQNSIAVFKRLRFRNAATRVDLADVERKKKPSSK